MTKHLKGNSGNSPKGPSEPEFGYRRPPVHVRFKRGQSGNPKGRPRGRRTVRTVVEEAVNQPTTISERTSHASYHQTGSRGRQHVRTKPRWEMSKR